MYIRMGLVGDLSLDKMVVMRERIISVSWNVDFCSEVHVGNKVR